MIRLYRLIIVFMFTSILPNSKSIALRLNLNLDIEDSAGNSKEIVINNEDLSKSHHHHNRHKHKNLEEPKIEDDKQLLHFLQVDKAIDFPDDGEPKTVVNRSSHPEEDIADDEANDENYPYVDIELYMQDRPHLQKYLSPPVPKINNRFGVTQEQMEDDGDTLCKSHINGNYRPKKLKNINGIERYIVNVDNYQQLLRTERCSSQSSRCTTLNLLRTTTSCVQRYSTRRLVVFSTNSSRYDEVDDFDIPSCCVCKMKEIKDDGNFLNYLF